MSEPVESMLKGVPIGLLIRSIFSGGFFVFSFYLSIECKPDWVKLDGKTIYEIALPLSLFSGLIVYGIQRAWVYPIVEWFFESSWGEWWLRRLPLMSPAVIDTTIWRWNLNQAEPTDNKSFNEQLTRWADMIHMQYNAALCIGFGSFAGWVVVGHSNLTFSWRLFSLAMVLFGSGFVANWRHYAFIKGVKKRKLLVEKIRQAKNDDQPKTGMP
ncbi:MAG TPA: hypothetical protein VGR14_00310 [Verrucomicrobiae bacterium]|jgi:hypothetical protein|nr:hypothetical protein [Verrucomicrobiae bacterium]